MIGFEIKTPYGKNAKPKKTSRYRFEFIMDEFRDKDLIEKLESQKNKADYIRKLIQEDIDRDTK